MENLCKDLKKQIERFRSQALLSRYEKAISFGNKILQNLKQGQITFGEDMTQVTEWLKKQINLCSELDKFRLETQKSQIPTQKTKKFETIEQKHRAKSTWNRNKIHQKHQEKKVIQQYQKVNVQSQKQIKFQDDSNEQEQIQEKLYKHLILPLNMPLFKLKKSIFLLVVKNCLSQVVNYLIDYEFIQFQSLQISDLGVQNIINAKAQMTQLGQNRSFIIVQIEQNQQKSIVHTKISKLSKIIEAYQQLEKSPNKNKQVLVLLIQMQPTQNQNHKGQTLHQKQVLFL